MQLQNSWAEVVWILYAQKAISTDSIIFVSDLQNGNSFIKKWCWSHMDIICTEGNINWQHNLIYESFTEWQILYQKVTITRLIPEITYHKGAYALDRSRNGYGHLKTTNNTKSQKLPPRATFRAGEKKEILTTMVQRHESSTQISHKYPSII